MASSPDTLRTEQKCQEQLCGRKVMPLATQVCASDLGCLKVDQGLWERNWALHTWGHVHTWHRATHILCMHNGTHAATGLLTPGPPTAGLLEVLEYLRSGFLGLPRTSGQAPAPVSLKQGALAMVLAGCLPHPQAQGAVLLIRYAHLLLERWSGSRHHLLPASLPSAVPS